MYKLRQIFYRLRYKWEHIRYIKLISFREFIGRNRRVLEIILSTITICIATALYLVTQRQADISKDTLTLMEKNAQIEMRAYVGTVDMNTVIPIAGKIPFFQFNLKNFGKTPANKVVFRKMIKIGTGIYDVDFNYLEKFVTENIVYLPPDVAIPQEHEYHRAVRRTEVDSINNGTLVWCILGIITYIDVFEKEHITTFAYKYDPRLKGIYAVKDYTKMR